MQLSSTLVDVAMGRKPADLVLQRGTWVCVQTGELIQPIDIALVDGRIAYVGSDASHSVGKDTVLIDSHGYFMCPGLMDAHMHIESGMLTVTEFVRAVIPHGSTGLFIDPHEIANVFGLRGVQLMVNEAKVQPIHVFVQVPSCVPSAPGLETPGAVITPQDVAEAMKWEGVIGLGEVMNFPGVIHSDGKMHEEIEVTRKAGKVIGGHYASHDLGRAFHAYAAGGAQDDHEGTRQEDAIARARQGMRVMMRFGSAWQDVAEQVKAVTLSHLDPRMFVLCTDDSHAQTLVSEGHMDRVLRHAISQGLQPMQAIQMMTINTAEHFGLSRDLGMIAPGRWGDIVLVKDLRSFEPEMVLAKGKVVYEAGKLLAPVPDIQRPEWAMDSLHLSKEINPEDFRLRVEKPTVRANVIGIVENQAPNHHLKMDVWANSGEIHASIEHDLAKVAVLERHHQSGRIQLGLVKGFHFKQPCAVATTVAHDSHQLIVVGTDDRSMVEAVNALRQCKGGQVVVLDGKVIGIVELPFAGLMSTESAEVVAGKTKLILDGFRTCGCDLNNPNMQLSLLGLVVIPDLRISDLGLVDVNRFDWIALFE